MMYLWLILGLATLVAGGEFLVRGAVSSARKFKISTLVIGMTVISFGTSAPELMVSLNSAVNGHPEIAIGNVVGSNIANLALVLGVTTMIFPIIVARNTKIIDWPMMMMATVLFLIFSLDLEIARWEGILMFSILVAFTVWLIRKSRKETKSDAFEEVEVELQKKTKPLLSITYLLLGLVGLYFGSEWMLKGAVSIASSFGMTERVIALTIVAFGTSVPELVTSAIAAFKKETDISVGNLIGSNLFNIFAVVGLTATVHPIAVDQGTVNFDMWWVVGIAIIILPMMLIGKKFGRVKGAFLLSTYVTYIGLLLYLT